MKRIFKIGWLLIFPLIAQGEEIEVSLPTQNLLVPITLSKIEKIDSSFTEKYLEEIREVLHFDLHYSGYMKVVDPKAHSKQENSVFSIKLRINKNNLLVDLFMRGKKRYESFSEMALSGNLTLDRRKVHELADNVLKKLLRKEGIAVAQIIYSVRKYHPQRKRKWLSQLWICDYDGKQEKRLTLENGYSVHPLFFPDGKHFLYVSYHTKQPKIYLSTLKSLRSVPLISLAGNQLLPAISLAGDKIAFISDVAGRPDLFLQRLDKKYRCDGKPIQLFSMPRTTQASPSFSPDGTKLAFVSDKSGSCRIYVIKIPKLGYVNKRPFAYLITRKNRENVTPSWSSDGTKLAYSAKTDGIRQIWIYDFETDSEWQLTTGRENKENPMWAPDSMHIIFNTEDKDSSELYLININQKQAVKISSGPGRKRFPSWRCLSITNKRGQYEKKC